MLDKTKSEIEKSHGDITENFKKFCKGKNKKKDKKKLQKKIENALKKKISQLVAVIGNFYINPFLIQWFSFEKQQSPVYDMK